MKIRLDQYIFEQGYAQSRRRAQALIMSGIVYVNNQKSDKAGEMIKETDKVEVRGKDLKYVSRGGLKLEKAMNEGIIPFNPCDRVCMPRKNRQDQFKGQAYTAEQANKLLEVIHGEVLEPVIMLGLLFGMRRSEALGLRWSDIDLEKQTIVISFTTTQMRTLLMDEHTKSATSHRMLSVMDDVIGYFKRCRRQISASTAISITTPILSVFGRMAVSSCRAMFRTTLRSCWRNTACRKSAFTICVIRQEACFWRRE